jgi:membrane protease YdiL (CAAX protease family)
MPTILSAALVGLLVLLAGSLPWGVLAALNQRHGVAWPWAAAIMTVYGLMYWQAIRGRWFLRQHRARCVALLRAHALTPKAWVLALGSGLAGFAALLALLAVAARLIALPEGPDIRMAAAMPLPTVLTLLVMQSLVAGVTEEAALRGYMQSLIEQRFGLVAAVIANGVWFGLLHFPSHPGDVLTMLPYYVAVAAVYGALTSAADSILPALVLHVVGDIVVLIRWWLTGLPEWQLTATPPPLLWESGVDAGFILALVLLALFTASCALGCRCLRQRVSR